MSEQSQEKTGSMELAEGESEERYILPLYQAAVQGNWEEAEKFGISWLKSEITPNKFTTLHWAVLHGQDKFVEKLLRYLDTDDLRKQTKAGDNVLTFAASVGNLKIAQLLVKRDSELVSITAPDLPVITAAMHGRRKLVEYLHPLTPVLKEQHEDAFTLLVWCIHHEFFDIALDILQHNVLLATYLSDDNTALRQLMSMPWAFESGNEYDNPIRQFVYYCMDVEVPEKTCHKDIESAHQSPENEKSIKRKGIIGVLRGELCSIISRHVPYLKNIYDEKVKHKRAKKLLRFICHQVKTKRFNELEGIQFFRATFIAAKNGILEFFEEVLEFYPDAIYWEDTKNKKYTVLDYAIENRRSKIFSLYYSFGTIKHFISRHTDEENNCMLHIAARMPDDKRLRQITGIALQMQREVQWYEAIEVIIPPDYKTMKNAEPKEAPKGGGTTAQGAEKIISENAVPESLFLKSHMDLIKEGQEWMIKTAESFSLVATLIASIMFQAAYNIPKVGNDQTMENGLLTVYMISDALSLFSSATSTLIFLGILTSRYTARDFSSSLPGKLIVGLFTLLFSIITMMITYGTAVHFVLKPYVPWIIFPLILLGCAPVLAFVIIQFPLLIEIYYNTYGHSLFDKGKK